MKSFSYLIVCMILISFSAFSQTDSVYYEFGVGSVASGATQTTDNFGAEPIPIGTPRVIPDPVGSDTKPMLAPTDESKLPPYVYVEDTNVSDNPNAGGGTTVLVQKFPGIPMTNFIPPDQIMAVGPNHIIACVNSQFSIWDKQGNLLKTINAGQWWAPAWPDENGDPQVIYDQFANRWVLVWMQYNSTNQTAGNLIAYSDDDDPLGTWYMFRLDTKTNGTISTNNWGDYPQLGYDDQAIYIMTRAFGFAGGGPFYSKIRIISKADLYTNTTAGFSYNDFWNIGLPGTPSIKPDAIHPTYCYTPGEGGYMFWANRGGGNYYAVYKFINPISSTPGLRGDTLHVQQYYNTPNAQQLGGTGQLRIEANGSHCKTAPVVRDGNLYMTHSVGNSNNPTYASAKYVIYNLASNSITEQAELGADGYYYIYPTITVDKDDNIAVTYSRSATTEYIGSYYSTKLAGDPPGLSPSYTLAEGQGTYVVDYGSGRNRWGDYLGICIDPTNEYDVWIFPEHAAATNTWGNYIGQIRMVPYSGIHTYVSSSTLAFGNVQINTNSDTLDLVVSNYGTDDLQITTIASTVGPFIRVSNNTIPVTLHSYDSLTVKVVFAPTEANDYDEVLSFTTNDPSFTGVHLTGHSYEMNVAYTDVFFASSGGGNNGDMLTIDRTTGVGTTLGSSLYGEVRSITVNPLSNIMYGLVSGGSNSEIVRINANMGDAYTLFTLDLTSLTGIDFNSTGDLYISSQAGDIYSVDTTSGDYTYVTTATHKLNAIAFDPNTDVLWGALWKSFGLGKDSVYTIDLTTGDATPIGVTGFGIMTNDMAFDEDNKLYGVTGTSNQEGKFFEINQTDGSGTLIGTGVGFNHTLGIAFSINGPVVSVDNKKSVIPKDFILMQNYPNPFNPSTKIEFALPVQSEVQLNIYNILGQKIKTLFEGQLQAGNHDFIWNADDVNGKKFSSGIYFYELKAKGNNGTEFQNTKKMLLLK